MVKCTIASILLLTTLNVFAADTIIGMKAPAFSLTDINGKTISLADFKGKYVVLEWTNFGCPFVKKHYESGNMQTLQKDETSKGVVWLSIASSAKGKEGYMNATEWQNAVKEHKSMATTVLLDEKGVVGRLYGAKTTPHMFVINPNSELIYMGAIDDKSSYDKEDIKDAKNYVRTALNEAMAGKKVSVAETKSYGCSVKY
jgi:peroxiredoxin